MKITAFVLTFISFISMAQRKEINAEKTAINSSKHRLDIDYVGDGMVGHRLDIHLPAAPHFPS